MKANGEFKFSYFFIGLGLGTIGALISAALARKDTRELLRDRGSKGLDYLSEQVGRLRETADGIVKKGKEFIAPLSDSVKSEADAQNQAFREERRENLGG